MSPHPDRPGAISTAIDLFLVAVVLSCLGILLASAWRVVSGSVRAVTRWKRKRAWLRGGGEDE